MSYYILRGGRPVHEPDVTTWAKWMESDTQRCVGDDTLLNGVRVSTVFLGIDHRMGQEPAPVLWETMIFGGPHDQWQDRYMSQQEAMLGHQRALRIARGEEEP